MKFLGYENATEVERETTAVIGKVMLYLQMGGYVIRLEITRYAFLSHYIIQQLSLSIVIITGSNLIST